MTDPIKVRGPVRVLLKRSCLLPKDTRHKSCCNKPAPVQKWIDLKPLPRPVYGSPGVVDIGSRASGGLKLIIGGYSDAGISDGILLYDIEKWSSVNVTMKYPRALFPIIQLK